MFGISRQAYYKRQNKLKKLESEREVILDLIKPIRKRMSRVGTIKLYDMIKNDMTKHNVNMGRDKLFTFLRQEKMLVKKKKNYTKTTDSFHRFRKHKNLIKDIEVNAPEQVWVSDITYIKTERAYLSIADY
jgi:putative transposase